MIQPAVLCCAVCSYSFDLPLARGYANIMQLFLLFLAQVMTWSSDREEGTEYRRLAIVHGLPRVIAIISFGLKMSLFLVRYIL